MELATLQSQVGAYFCAHAAEFGLDPARVRAGYILNWGGFVNRSFQVTDGRVRLHVKLYDGEMRAASLPWRRLHAILEERYHAPPMRGWAAIPGTPYEGPVTDWIDGHAPEEVAPDLLARVLPVVHRLHRDRDLADRLAPGALPRPCVDTYMHTYHERFVGDLEEMAAPPPFVSEELMAWMWAEAERLAERVRACPAFQERASSPIHGDLWPDNLLVTRERAWFLLDWDDLAIGDPALDLVTLLGPSPANLQARRWQELPPGALDGPGLYDRLELYARASLLDFVIDPLADWVEAVAAPAHLERVRPVKERVHRQALALYRGLYG